MGQLMDDLLDEVSDFVFDDDMLYSIYTMAGSYVFEVARKNYGGEYYWIQEEEQPILVAGEPDFFVKIKAWEKVRKRMSRRGMESCKLCRNIQRWKEICTLSLEIKNKRTIILSAF